MDEETVQEIEAGSDSSDDAHSEEWEEAEGLEEEGEMNWLSFLSGKNPPTVLDLGCGNNKQPGAYGVDIEPSSEADWHCDLEELPWPFPDNHFQMVYAFQVLEHFKDRVGTMQELYRICRHGALVVVSVPDGLCPGYVQDPTHKSPWNIGTFLYFCPGQWPKEWDDLAYDLGVHFRVLDYYVHQGESRPYAGKFYRDDLRVYLQVIKE